MFLQKSSCMKKSVFFPDCSSNRTKRDTCKTLLVSERSTMPVIAVPLVTFNSCGISPVVLFPYLPKQ